MTEAFSLDAATLANGAVSARLGLTGEDVDAGLEVARRHIGRGDPAEALKMYAMLAACEPRRHEIHLGLGGAALQLGENDLALRAANAATALAPRDPRNALLAGRACLSMGLRAEAREDFDLAVALGLAARDAGVVLEARRFLVAVPA